MTESTFVQERRHASFFKTISSSLSINTAEEFYSWSKGDLQRIFPHAMMICGIGQLENTGVRAQQVINCNFPEEYIKSLQQAGGLISSPIIAQWLKTRRPVLFELTGHYSKSAWLENFKHYGLRNLAAHGHCDLHSSTASYFTFAQIPGTIRSRHANLLEMLVPHLHMALQRIVNGGKNESLAAGQKLLDLTNRQREILQWLASGKTNWEIAQVLHISEHTVKTHVQRILIKLKVNTRAQAVGKGLIPG